MLHYHPDQERVEEMVVLGGRGWIGMPVATLHYHHLLYLREEGEVVPEMKGEIEMMKK